MRSGNKRARKARELWGGPGACCPGKFGNLKPQKSPKMLPILSIIGKMAHNVSQFFLFVFTFCTK